jgi:hypothetical protein
MIKAAVLLAEKDMGETITARVYLVMTHSNGVVAAIKTEEIEFKDPEGLLDGKSLVARRSTEPKVTEGITEWNFLDALGLFNRINALVIVKEIVDDDSGSDNAS